VVKIKHALVVELRLVGLHEWAATAAFGRGAAEGWK
jgi:hypothetical protein